MKPAFITQEWSLGLGLVERVGAFSYQQKYQKPLGHCATKARSGSESPRHSVVNLESHQCLVFTAPSNRRASCHSGREGDTVAVATYRPDRVARR